MVDIVQSIIVIERNKGLEEVMRATRSEELIIEGCRSHPRLA